MVAYDEKDDPTDGDETTKYKIPLPDEDEDEVAKAVEDKLDSVSGELRQARTRDDEELEDSSSESSTRSESSETTRKGD